MMILFIQLPLSDHSRGYINGNIQYAAAVLSGYISRKHIDVNCETLPAVITNFGSNELILKYVAGVKPDIVCFTSYLWNIERNLQVAGMLKKHSSGIKIFFGGPEIAPGSIAFDDKRSCVDMFIMGEGEWFFDIYLSGGIIPEVHIAGNRVSRQPDDELIPAEDIQEPLSGKRLNTMIDGSVFMELTRGCPYKCSYCYYSRNSGGVRELPFSLLIDSIENISGLTEIYILSPTFDRSTDFKEHLTQLKNLNHDVSLHTEIRADRIDAEISELMYDAGFRSLEVGLQSLNKRALKNVHRSGNTENELRGMACLKNAGIDIKIGIIPGLPGDNPESFIFTVDTLIERGLAENIELYPLMILPGTEIRELADSQNISYLSKPPYFYHQGWGFTYDDIKAVTSYVENKTGLSQSIEFIPDFTVTEDPLYITGLRGDSCNGNLWDISYITKHTDTTVNDLHVFNCSDEDVLAGIEQLSGNRGIDRYFNVIFYHDFMLNYRILTEVLAENESDNFHRRLNIYNSFMDGSLIRFFHVTRDTGLYADLCEFDDIVAPLIYAYDENIHRILNFIGEENDAPVILLDKGIYEKIKDPVIEIYSSQPHLLAFKSEVDMHQFYYDIELEFLNYPYGFGIKSV